MRTLLSIEWGREPSLLLSVYHRREVTASERDATPCLQDAKHAKDAKRANAGGSGGRHPSSAQPPRLARLLARAPPPGPPSPETGVARRPACGGDDSRGGCPLRFGARYGSSDSLPRDAGHRSRPPLGGLTSTRRRASRPSCRDV